jgi:aryl-alcohol dehydrogenase-like predicted oxidoreductase
VILGLWPIAGITTIGVTAQDARATIEAAIESGITWFDTAFSYGYEGQSDRLLGEMIRGDRDRLHVIGKVGQRWDDDRRRIVDASPATLTRDAITSLGRIGIDQFDVLLLHSPDPNVPLAQSAQAMHELQCKGICRAVGVCNVTSEQYREFDRVLRSLGGRCSAIQCPLNLLQQDHLQELIPNCKADGCAVDVYWTLMKGLLAGQIGRDHQFAPGDSRPGYAIYQGEAREHAHRLLDAMAPIARSAGLTIAQLSIGWSVSQPGVRAALVGARRASQVREIAATRALPSELLQAIERQTERLNICE